MAQQFLPVLFALAAALLTAAGVLGLAVLTAQRPRHTAAAKRSTYESGVPLIDRGYKRISVRFYLITLVFVVLDVEVAFLYPWAVTYRELLEQHSTVILWDMVAFIALLAVAYAYLWRTGVFDWGRAKQLPSRGGER